MLSVIIPARNEPYLQKTIDDILKNARGPLEVIAVLDGYWPDPPIYNHPQVVLIHNSVSTGMRASINAAARIAKGKYLLKCDAHCAFDEGFNTKLVESCEYEWTVVPVRYSLDSNNWTPKLDKKYEFEYISSDDLKGRRWPEYAKRVEGNNLPVLMTFQGSCWFMHRDRFFEIGCLDEDNYGGMGREAQEICLKSWLSGGKCVLNRNTWYAHWSKSKKDIRFSCREEKQKSVNYAVDFWKNNKWDKAIRTLDWLAANFAPVPTWEQKETEIMKPADYIKTHYNLIEKGKDLLVEKMTRAGMYKLFKNLGYRSGAEIGVQRGRNAKVILDSMDIDKLYLVEPYDDHPSNYRRWGQKLHQKFKKMAHKRLEGQPVIWLEDFSENISHKVPDGSLDFVYIDGEHTYDYCMIDIILWSRKVRRGGIVAGHDYEYTKPRQPKVARAINDYADAYKTRPIYLTDKSVDEHAGDRSTSWFWVKP